jgi:hypothetical protein
MRATGIDKAQKVEIRQSRLRSDSGHSPGESRNGLCEDDKTATTPG